MWLSNNDFENKIIKNGGYSRTNNYQKHIDISHSIENIFERSDYLKRKSIEQILENKKIFPHVLINRLKKYAKFKTKSIRRKIRNFRLYYDNLSNCCLYFFYDWYIYSKFEI